MGKRQLYGIIGPNGAGKTSILNSINGFYRAQSGEVLFEAKCIKNLRPDKIARLGISRTFQNTQPYTGLTVVENLMAARHSHYSYTWIEGGLLSVRARREEVQHRRAANDILDFLRLGRWKGSLVASLPYGVRKRVDMGRALVQEPKMLLLDEPMAGMTADEKDDMTKFILQTRRETGITIVIIEHDMRVVMGITDRILVLDFGRKIAEGSPDQVKHDPVVIKAYLGESRGATA